MGKNKYANQSFTEMMKQVDDIVPTPKIQSAPTNPTYATPEQLGMKPIQEPVQVPEDHTVTTDNEGQTVAKPTVDTVATSIKIDLKKTQKTTEIDKKTDEAIQLESRKRDEVLRMERLIEEYLKTNNGFIMRSEEERDKAGAKFRDILFFAVEHPHRDVLDVLYKFFYRHKNKILVPQIALPPVLNLQKSTLEKVSCIYTLFKGITDDTPFNINPDNTRLLLRGMDPRHIEELLLYVDTKNKNK